jgi:hypothetical protein
VQFEFSGTPIPGDEIHLELDVLVDGHLFSGHASSEFPRTGERLITRSEVRARDAAKVEQEMAIRASDLVESRSAATVEPARAVCSRSEYRGEQ